MPSWIVAAEIVETSRVFARTVAKIDPRWIERSASHLLKKTHAEPHWEKRRGQVVAFEQATLYGLVVYSQRKVNFGPIDPPLARKIFIRAALVERQMLLQAAFFRHNAEVVEQVEAMESKVRKRDILVDDQVIFDFYDALIPTDVNHKKGFEKWRRECEKKDPACLFMSEQMLLRRDTAGITASDYPDTWMLESVPLPLSYRFEPGHPEDGVTLTVPLALLAQLDTQRLQWLVPGMLADKCQALLRLLPKSLRKILFPSPVMSTLFCKHKKRLMVHCSFALLRTCVV